VGLLSSFLTLILSFFLFGGFVIQVQYKSDCEELYGRILDNSNVVSSIQGTCKRQTEEIWNRLYPEEPYNFNITQAFSENISEKLPGVQKYTKYDLVSAVKRQSPFFYQVILIMNFCFFLSVMGKLHRLTPYFLMSSICD
jgi:hypothetical protein